MKNCAFCPTQASKLSGEHLFDDWLNRGISAKGYKARYGTLEKETIEWDAHSLNHKLPAVCSPCNNGWMSQLTEELKTGFADCILQGTPLLITPSALSVLSAYTFLKAAVMDYTYCEGEPFFTRAARERFRVSRTIPSDGQVWVAAFRGRSVFGARANIRHYSSTQPGTPVYGIEWFAFTYVVGHLAVQLLMPRWKDVRHRGRPLPRLSPHLKWKDGATRIWPLSGVSVRWPPSRFVGEAQFDIFANRFGGESDFVL